MWQSLSTLQLEPQHTVVSQGSAAEDLTVFGVTEQRKNDTPCTSTNEGTGFEHKKISIVRLKISMVLTVQYCCTVQ